MNDDNQFDHIDFGSTIAWAMICSEIELREQGKTNLFLTDAELRDKIDGFERDAKEAIRIMMQYTRHRLDMVAVQPTCQHCGEPFEPIRRTGKYCSTRCRVAAHRVNANKPANASPTDSSK
ncbi:hypothetical protein ACS3QZ_02680 [Shimia sp. W99]